MYQGDQSTMFKGKFWVSRDEDSKDQDRSASERQEQPVKESTPMNEEEVVINDWRAAVSTKFAITGPNSSRI